ncbi:ABC transporter substrate-binding protein [Clostridium sp. FAM 1755]|uniref:ABC transporter substrate-binding protein n=1 Tax=Clostridium caseinilyticum TaxID=3350403 RepID=UPI0038F5D7F6
MKKKVISILLLVIFLISAVGCTNSKKEVSKENKETIHLNIGYAPGIGNMLCFIAQDKGLFKEENLEVELIPFTNSSDGLNALNSGKLDLGISFGTAAPLTFITNGANFSFFGGYLSGGHPIYAKKEVADKYKGIKDFKGKKVATPRLYTPDIVWRSAMDKAGINIKSDLELIEMKKPTDVLEAVKSGKADIGIGTGSTYAKAKQAGLEIVDWSNNLWNDHVCCRPVAKTDFIEKNPKSIKKFLKVMIKAEKVWTEEPEFAVKMNEKYLKLDKKMAEEVTLKTNQVIESDPKRKGIIDMWNRMSEIGYLDHKGVNIEDHINIKMYKEALDEMIKENPNDDFYKKLEKRYKEYNID